MIQLSCLDRPIILDSISNVQFDSFLPAHDACKVVVFVDENTHAHCWPKLAQHPFFKNAELIELPAGEQSKSLDYCAPVWQSLTELQCGRNDVLVALGGGVMTDLAGFIAATYKRGMKFLSIPTSLLAMVDASIGGKTGIDFLDFKNHIGTFYIPDLIVIDNTMLDTLPEDELLNGMAEMYKHGLINTSAHALEVHQLLKQKSIPSLEQISSSMKIKIDIVERDPKEKGERKLLNLGHTIGHAIEKYWLTRNVYPHGLAVAQGLLLEAEVSVEMGLLSESDFDQMKSSLSLFPIRDLPKDGISDMLESMANDKKNSSNQWLFSLPKGIGSSKFDVVVDSNLVEKVLRRNI